MIRYRTDGIHPFWNLFKWKGSVYPVALKFAIPSAGISAFVKWTMLHTDWWSTPEVVSNNAVWTGFTVLVGFLVIFRSSQAYNRFLEGCSLTHKMRAEWFDSCAGILAFSAHNKADDAEKTYKFRSLVVRLFSMLHATALAEIEDTNSNRIADVQAFRFELLDAESIDHDTLDTIRTSCTKPELVYYWINQVVVEGMSSGLLTVPPPILSRSFQTIANGMVAFHEAVRLSSIQFPFPYAQACDWLLLFHWLCVPVVTAQWSIRIPTACAFAFIQVFTLWSLNGIGQELENPFGSDFNDLDCLSLHLEMNKFLEMLVEPEALRLPEFVGETKKSVERLSQNRASFFDVWRSESRTEVNVMGSVRVSSALTRLTRIIRRHSANMIQSGATAVTQPPSPIGTRSIEVASTLQFSSKQTRDTTRSLPELEPISPREQESIVNDSPALPIALAACSGSLESERFAIGHAIGNVFSEDTRPQPAGSSSLIPAYSDTGDGHHAHPNWHNESIPSTPPDLEAPDLSA